MVKKYSRIYPVGTKVTWRYDGEDEEDKQYGVVTSVYKTPSGQPRMRIKWDDGREWAYSQTAACKPWFKWQVNKPTIILS